MSEKPLNSFSTILLNAMEYLDMKESAVEPLDGEMPEAIGLLRLQMQQGTVIFLYGMLLMRMMLRRKLIAVEMSHEFFVSEIVIICSCAKLGEIQVVIQSGACSFFRML
jgi:hypothetical protein